MLQGWAVSSFNEWNVKQERVLVLSTNTCTASSSRTTSTRRWRRRRLPPSTSASSPRSTRASTTTRASSRCPPPSATATRTCSTGSRSSSSRSRARARVRPARLQALGQGDDRAVGHRLIVAAHRIGRLGELPVTRPTSRWCEVTSRDKMVNSTPHQHQHNTRCQIYFSEVGQRSCSDPIIVRSCRFECKEERRATSNLRLRSELL